MLCCYTDGLVERRDQLIDQRMDELGATQDQLITAGAGGLAEPNAEDACATAMRTLVGNSSAQDDIAVVMLSRP